MRILPGRVDVRKALNDPISLPSEQRWRSNTYALLARLLSAAPDTVLLTMLARLPPPLPDNPQPLPLAWRELSRAAGATTVTDAAEEFAILFIGMTRGELLPYGSFYQTGFLQEKPLADLRADLQTLGIQRQEQTPEPEDHIAALCEVMSLLIMEQHPRQAEFFQRHLIPWQKRFFADLQGCAAAKFYRTVARLGNAFMDLEAQYLSLPE